MSNSVIHTDTDVAYAAGLFDGEGTVGVERYGGRGYNVTARVTNTNLDVLEWLRSRFGGFTQQAYAAHDNRKACFYWTAKAKIAEAFLEAVRPYLIIKRRQATIALIVRKFKNDTKSKHDMSPEQREVEKFFAELVKADRAPAIPSLTTTQEGE